MDRKTYIQHFISLTQKLDQKISSDRLYAAGEFFYLLHEANQIHNLTGYHTIEDFFIFHFCDTLNLIKHLNIEDEMLITDIGTGAGIPGMLIKILCPSIRVCLVESIKKKITFLVQVKTHFQLKSCHLLAERAEIIAQQSKWRESSDVVMARALSSLSCALELTCPFAKIGGAIILPRGSREDSFEQSHAETILGCTLQEELFYKLPARDNRHRLLIYKKFEHTNAKYPRKPGQIKKRPL